MADPDEQLLTPKEAGEILGVHPNTLRNWVTAGKLSERRVGVREDRRYLLTEVEKVRDEMASRPALPSVPAALRDMRSTLAMHVGGPAPEVAASNAKLVSVIGLNDSALIRMTRDVQAMASYLVDLQRTIRTYELALGSSFAKVVEGNRRAVEVAASVMGPFLALDASIRDSFNPFVADLVEQMDRIGHLMGSVGMSYSAAQATALADAVSPSALAFREMAKLAIVSPSVADLSFRLSRDYASFSERAVDMVPRMPDENEANLGIGIWSAGGSVVKGTLGPMRELASYESQQVPADDATVRTLFDSVLAHAEGRKPSLLAMADGPKILAAIDGLVPVRIAKEVLRLLATRARLSSITEKLGRKPMFSDSWQTQQAGLYLQWHTVEDEAGFARALTLLYQLIYEGSSDLDRIDDRFKSDDSMLWHFKHMRLIETHDVHHGDPGKQAQQMREVGDAFLHFGGNLEPRAPNEWERAHLAVISQLADLLEQIEDFLTSRP